MHSIKNQLLSQMNCPLYLISLDEAAALLSIINDLSGLSMVVSSSENRVTLSSTDITFYIEPAPGSLKGRWSEDTCTDSIVISMTNTETTAKSVKFTFNSTLTLKGLIEGVMNQVIIPATTPLVKPVHLSYLLEQLYAFLRIDQTVTAANDVEMERVATV